MTNCTLLQTTESFLSRKALKAEPTIIDVTPVQPAVPALPVPAKRAAPLTFLEVKPKARRASKKTAAQSFFELLLAAASLLFLAMT